MISEKRLREIADWPHNVGIFDLIDEIRRQRRVIKRLKAKKRKEDQ